MTAMINGAGVAVLVVSALLVALDVGNPPESFDYPLLLIFLLLAFLAIPTVIILLRRARRGGKGR